MNILNQWNQGCVVIILFIFLLLSLGQSLPYYTLIIEINPQKIVL